MIATLLRLKEKIMSSLYSQQSKSNIKFHLEPTAFYNTENKTAVHQLFYDLQSKACLGFYIDNQIDATTTIDDRLDEPNCTHHHKIVHKKDGDFVIIKQSKLTNLKRIKQSMILLEFSLLLDLFKNYLDKFYVHKWDFQDNYVHFLHSYLVGYRTNENTIWDNCDQDVFCFVRSLGEFNTAEELKHNIRSALDINIDKDGRNLVEYYQTHHLSYPILFNENKQNLRSLISYISMLRIEHKDEYNDDLLKQQAWLKHNPKLTIKMFDFLHPLFNVLTINNYGKLKYTAKLELLKSEFNTGNSSLINEMCDLNDKILGKDYSFLDTLSKHLLDKSNSLYWLDNYHINYSNAKAVQLNCNDKLQSTTDEVKDESVTQVSNNFEAATQSSGSLQETAMRKTKKKKYFNCFVVKM